MVNLRRIAGALSQALAPRPPADVDTGGGLPFAALYPTTPSAGLVQRSPGRIVAIGASTSSSVLLVANAARVGATIRNDGTANLYLALGAYASTSGYTALLPAGATYILEGPDCYVGSIAGVWDVANGSARVTEQTAGQ